MGKTERLLRLASVAIICAVIIWFFKVQGCGEEKLVDQTVIPNPERPKTDCGRVTFTEVKPIITAKCVSCHQGFDQFATASVKGATMVARVTLDPGSPSRMPKQPNPPLSADEQQLFKLWQSDGFVEACPTTAPQKKTFTFDDIERAIEDEGAKLSADDREDSRFLVLTHKLIQGSTAAEMALFAAGAHKGLNSLNTKNSRLQKLFPLGPENSILRFQLSDFGLSKQDWENIEKFDAFKIISQTKRGKNIATIFKENQVWMHYDNFMITVYGNSRLYYSLIRVLGLTRDQVLNNLGVNFLGDQRNFTASFIGTSRSPISDQKPRLLTRFKSNDGDAWLTFDPDTLNGIQARNLFSSPLLIDTRKPFDFAANELIFQLKNNMQGYALFDKQGNLLDKALITIVHDNLSPISAEISMISCSRCHAGGLIPATDEIKNHVKTHASNFGDVFNGLTDAQRVDGLYHEQSVNDVLFKNYNEIHGRGLQVLGATPQIDPITFATDKIQLNWDLNQFCSFIFVADQKECVADINASQQGSQELGGVVTGASISFDQVKIGFKFVERDARLFQDPLGK